MSDKNQTAAEAMLGFYRTLNPDFRMSDGIHIMNPFTDPVSWLYTEKFYKKYYSDNKKRKIIFGINPGRFGGGITGIPFTDPIRLKQDCGIDNPFQQKPELSSVFIYEVVKAYGGPSKFYSDFFISALSPLGFTKNGINLNYYDDKQLIKDSRPFIIDCIQQQIEHLHIDRNKTFCLGEGTNYSIFRKLNEENHFFSEIIPLPHPRWVMQYRRKTMDQFVQKYLDLLTAT